MNTIPLTSVRDVFVSHMLLATRPDDEDSQLRAFVSAAEAWGDEYLTEIIRFGDAPFETALHGPMFYGMALLYIAKAEVVDKDVLMGAAMQFTITLYEEVGLPVEAFVALVELPGVPGLGQFIESFLYEHIRTKVAH